MFLKFFYLLRTNGLPVSLHEYLTLMQALKQKIVAYSVDDFYALSRTILVKQEAHLDRFDKLFGHFFAGKEWVDDGFFGTEIPEDWIYKNLMNNLTEEEKAMIEALGGPEALMERFKELLKEQKERHEGGNTWIGTGGTSPFGANGYNPEGYRIGQQGSRHRSAIKVWDKREFANLDDSVELDTRNIKLALKRLRRFTREGIPTELDIDETIRLTSHNAGMLELSMRAEKKNRVKVLLLIDVGGSMDDHIAVCERLFSAAKHEFKHLEHYYFHNCLYETVWKDNNRRHDRVPTLELLHKYNKDYKVIFIGDAAMSPYEILYEGGSVEHYNDETGRVWLNRLKAHFDHLAWINPNDKSGWDFYQSTKIIKEIVEDKMYPMTIAGLTETMRSLR